MYSRLGRATPALFRRGLDLGLAFASVFLVASLRATTANAYERQFHAGASVGYAVASQESSFGGFGGALHLTYGLSDAFNGLAELGISSHPGADVLVLNGSIGAAYVVDVLEWVPYAGVMAGGYDLWSLADACGQVDHPACHGLRMGVSVPFGVDYQLSREVAVGVAGRYHWLPGTASVQYLTAYARAEYIWGF